MSYEREAIAPSLKGIITCGSASGYENSENVSLEKLLFHIKEINEEFVAERKNIIPCIVRKGNLIGRASDSSYKETIYTIEFSYSPRLMQIQRDTFYETLIEYANRIGNRMQQERIYLEFDCKTEVLKRNYI